MRIDETQHQYLAPHTTCSASVYRSKWRCKKYFELGPGLTERQRLTNVYSKEHLVSILSVIHCSFLLGVRQEADNHAMAERSLSC